VGRVMGRVKVPTGWVCGGFEFEGGGCL